MGSRTWDLTLNNYTKNDISTLKTWVDDVNRMVVSKEKGETGTKHLQGRITFKRTYRLTALKKLHSKIHWEETKCNQDSLYCMKEGSKIIIDVDNRKKSNNELKEVANKVKQGASKETIWNEHPEAMIRHNKGVYEMMSVISKPKVKAKYKLSDFRAKPVTDWNQSVILLGTSGCGKTMFAKAHFDNPLFVSHIDDLRLLTNENDGIIFDDMDFKHWPRTSQIHILDIDDGRSINIKYGTAYIPPNMRKIFTCNEMPFDVEDKAIKRRMNIIAIVEDQLW